MGLILLPEAHGPDQVSRASHHDRRKDRRHDQINLRLAEQVSREAQDLPRHV